MHHKILNFLRRPKFFGDNDIKPLHHVLFWSIYFVFNTFRWSFIHDDFLLSFRTNLIGFPVNTLTIGYAIQTMIGEVYVISFFTAIKLTIDWLRESSKLHDLEKRQLKTELRFLRSQVSPHFFFNTLNNIYSLTLEKSDQAPEVILKLSELMRYLLYATKKQRQDLTSEINCIKNYIDLERIRFDDSLKIEMLLIPLVENCFKHGASKNIGEMKIDIDLQVIEGFMIFKVSNTIPNPHKEFQYPVKSGGIGLSNVKKRLELGYAKSDYELSIFDENKMFNVILKLKVI